MFGLGDVSYFLFLVTLFTFVLAIRKSYLLWKNKGIGFNESSAFLWFVFGFLCGQLYLIHHILNSL